MLARFAWLVSTLLLSTPLLAGEQAAPAQNICDQAIPTIRELWSRSAYDASPELTSLMVDVIDGKLPQVRHRLAAVKPSEIARWRQTAMLTAVYTKQASVVDALLDDGASVDAMGWVPPLKRDVYTQVVGDMSKDPQRAGPSTAKGLAASGLTSNQEGRLGPALVIAAQCSDVATLDVLLRHHANVMQREAPNIVDALTAAVLNGDAVIVQHLLDHGADSCLHDRQVPSNKPAATLANIGHRAGLPESLSKRLTCRAMASKH